MTRLRDCLLFAALTSVISTGALAQANTQVSALADSGSGWFTDWSKEDKALALNLGVGAAVLGWGVVNWDYGEGGPRFQSEGWFDRETEEGGADKLGHFYSAYLFSHLFAGQYERWDFDKDQAIRWGALPPLGVTGLIEVGDAFSDYGFSYEDMIFNTLGAAAGYLLWSFPELSGKIDLRVEYNPFTSGGYDWDVTTDYDRLSYLIALKAEGFDFIENPYLKYLELHVGFRARNYSDYSERPEVDLRKQFLYVGIGLNLSKLLRPYLDTPVFNYLQVPYTYVPATYQISGPK
jgi:Predicted periplasmic lipoprotein (DUF2279)